MARGWGGLAIRGEGVVGVRRAGHAARSKGNAGAVREEAKTWGSHLIAVRGEGGLRDWQFIRPQGS